MYRAAFRLPRRRLVVGTLAGTAIVLETTPREEKLSIYPTPTPDILLVEEPSPLEHQIGVARRSTTQAVRDAHSQTQELVSKWIGVEHAVENRIKSIVDPTEPLTPGALYVGIAALSGSVIARNRFIGTRLLLPPAFFFLALNHFLPKTSHNLSSYFASLEETYFPTLAQKHDVANAHSAMAWERLKESSKEGREKLAQGTENLVDKIQELTGLRLKENLGWGSVKKVEGKVLEAVKAFEHKVEESTNREKVEKSAGPS
ncbi:hypothetical protein BDN72DRAFT_962195 [Pluteus cervinus]|uniref:Uncharacterized protein n=1 Tax=Pluteus cervinus TaxID=181527 RepID=A0ACD3AJM8_9AGAR|nr:hypothetical protein BDN72DRAFT_962195 [Pluteus cervinus]